MILRVLQGLSKVTAALTGLLLVYVVVYAMEGMTTRLPMSQPHELAVTTLWMLPWTLLLCSGLEDLEKTIGQHWVLWSGVTLALTLLYYLERHTSDAVLTKAAMPLLATLIGLLPHVIRRISFVFVVFSLAAGIAGLVLSYFFLASRLISGSTFATNEVAILVLSFVAASIATGVLSVAELWRRLART